MTNEGIDFHRVTDHELLGEGHAVDTEADLRDLCNDLANALLSRLIDGPGPIRCKTQLELRAARHLIGAGWAEAVPDEPGRGDWPAVVLLVPPAMDEIIDFDRNPNFVLQDEIEASNAKADEAAAGIEKNLLARIRPKT